MPAGYTAEELFGNPEGYTTEELFGDEYEYEQEMSPFERGQAKREKGGLRQELMSGVDRLTGEWLSGVADTTQGIAQLNEWLKKVTGMSKYYKPEYQPGGAKAGGIFQEAAEDWAAQGEYYTGRGRQDVLGDVLAGLGGAAPAIAEITALGGGLPGMAIHGGLKGYQHGGPLGAATGAATGALTHGALGGIAKLPKGKRWFLPGLKGPAALFFGGVTATGRRAPSNLWELLVGTADFKERAKGGFTWWLLDKSGRGTRIPFTEFMERYPRMDKASKTLNAKYMINKLDKAGVIEGLGIDKEAYDKLTKAEQRIEYIDEHLRAGADYRTAPEMYGTIRRIKNKYSDQNVGDKPLGEFKPENFTTDPVEPSSYKKHYSGLPLPEKFQTTAQKILDAFQIEPQFDRLGMPDVGRALKLLPTRQKMYTDQGFKDIKDVLVEKYKDFTPEEWQELYLLAGKKELPPDKKFRFQEAHKDYVGLIDKWQAKLKEKGIPADWPASLIERLGEREVELNREYGKRISGERRAEINQELDDIGVQLKFLDQEGIRYAPITRQMIQGYFEKQPQVGSSKMNEFFRERKTYDLDRFVKWLIEKGEIEPKDIDAKTVYAQYVSATARKLAVADVFIEAKKGGALIPKAQAPDNYVGLPAREFPTLRGFKAHPLFADYMQKNFVKMGWLPPEIGKVLGTIKMLQFYNPAFLPMYDIKQAWWSGAQFSPYLPKAIKQAWTDMRTKGDNYWEALYWGLTSTPFAPHFEQFNREVKLLSEKNSLARQAKKHLRAPAYRFSWEAAWTMDNFIRLVTYNTLRKGGEGLSSKDAAYNAARIHGDYASVPPAMRRKLNKIFFTPTFKIVMMAAQVEMFKEAGKALSYASGISKDKPSKREAHMARAAAGLLSAIALREATFHLLGFESDQFGLKYSKEYIDENGERREMIVHAASPDNVFLRYFHRFKTLPTEPDKVTGFINRLKWDLNPLYQFGHELMTNKGVDFTPIYGNFDSTEDVMYDIGKYTLKRLLPIVTQLPSMRSQERQKTFQALQNDLGTVAHAIRPFTLQYTRNNAEARASWKINDMIRRFKEESRDNPPKTEQELNERVKRLEERLRKLQKELESKAFDSPYRKKPRKGKGATTEELFK